MADRRGDKAGGVGRFSVAVPIDAGAGACAARIVAVAPDPHSIDGSTAEEIVHPRVDYTLVGSRIATPKALLGHKSTHYRACGGLLVASVVPIPAWSLLASQVRHTVVNRVYYLRVACCHDTNWQTQTKNTHQCYYFLHMQTSFIY